MNIYLTWNNGRLRSSGAEGCRNYDTKGNKSDATTTVTFEIRRAPQKGASALIGQMHLLLLLLTLGEYQQKARRLCLLKTEAARRIAALAFYGSCVMIFRISWSVTFIPSAPMSDTLLIVDSTPVPTIPSPPWKLFPRQYIS